MTSQLPMARRRLHERLLLWAFSLLGIAALLFVIEIVVPAASSVSLRSPRLSRGRRVLLREHHPRHRQSRRPHRHGPLAINFALKVFPNTPIGKRLILGEDENDEASGRATPRGRSQAPGAGRRRGDHEHHDAPSGASKSTALRSKASARSACSTPE